MTFDPHDKLSGGPRERLERVVILRNDHMTIAHCAISVLQLPCTGYPWPKECNQLCIYTAVVELRSHVALRRLSAITALSKPVP